MLREVCISLLVVLLAYMLHVVCISILALAFA